MLIAVVVVVFVAIGAFVALHGMGGGGANRTFDLTVTGDKMTPDTLTVKQNDNVTITVNVDKAEEIHLHGYDIHFDAAPGKPATHSFKADKTGNFDIEIEDTSTGVGSLVVQQ
ncbi:MAG TPA: cupredoxin domain-containing protein [Candidatus Dormibacteraeota bacterium]